MWKILGGLKKRFIISKSIWQSQDTKSIRENIYYIPVPLQQLEKQIKKPVTGWIGAPQKTCWPKRCRTPTPQHLCMWPHRKQGLHGCRPGWRAAAGWETQWQTRRRCGDGRRWAWRSLPQPRAASRHQELGGRPGQTSARAPAAARPADTWLSGL